jgi:hypothetical protein
LERRPEGMQPGLGSAQGVGCVDTVGREQQDWSPVVGGTRDWWGQTPWVSQAVERS